MSKTIKVTNQAWLQELDPTKRYVVMFQGQPPKIVWDERPDYILPIMLNARSIELQDADQLRDILEQLELRVKRGSDVQ